MIECSCESCATMESLTRVLEVYKKFYKQRNIFGEEAQ
jgi:hypothetical protein